MLCLLSTTLLSANAAESGLNLAQQELVFVCDHGSAKSMIAAAYFNQIAAQRGLNYHAVSRGITVDAELQGATRQGLQNDGLSIQGLIPKELTEKLAQQARQVITIGLEKRPAYLQNLTTMEWNDVPPVSVDYQKSRDNMKQKIESLLLQLEAKK